MKRFDLAARSLLRNTVFCTLATLGLAACGGESSTTASTTGSIVQPNVGMIDRNPVADTSTAPASNTATSSQGSSTASTSNQGSTTTGTSSQGSTTQGSTVLTPPVKIVSTGTATLDWTPPTENSDGTALTNLAGYTVYYGTSPDALTESIKVTNPGLTAYTVSNLTSGTWYFAVTAYSTAGVESSRTGIISTKI